MKTIHLLRHRKISAYLFGLVFRLSPSMSLPIGRLLLNLFNPQRRNSGLVFKAVSPHLLIACDLKSSPERFL